MLLIKRDWTRSQRANMSFAGLVSLAKMATQLIHARRLSNIKKATHPTPPLSSGTLFTLSPNPPIKPTGLASTSSTLQEQQQARSRNSSSGLSRAKSLAKSSRSVVESVVRRPRVARRNSWETWIRSRGTLRATATRRARLSCLLSWMKR